MVWGGVTASHVRLLTDLGSLDISDSNLTSLITWAGSQFNAEVAVKIIEEPVEYIDSYRQNKIDGSNTTYYVQKSWDWYLGDLDDDGDVDEDDVTVYSYNPSTDTKTALTVSSVTDAGQITLSSTPASNLDLKITYRYMPLDMDHFLVRRAVAELTAALAYSKVEARDKKKVSLGQLSVQRTPMGFKEFYNRYMQTVSEINSRQLLRKQVAPIRVPQMPYYTTQPEETTGTGALYR